MGSIMRQPPRPRGWIRGTGIWALREMRPSGFQTGEFHDLCPFFGFIGYELAEVGGRTWKLRAANVRKPCLDLRVGEPGVDLLVQLINNLPRRVLGHAHAEPRACFKARYVIAHGRQVR